MLPISSKDREFEKWSSNWEGPFKVHQVLPGNAYWLSSLERESHKRFINGKYLKKYFSTMWEMLDIAKKNKVGNEEIIRKIGHINHFRIGETIPCSYFK